MSSEPVTLPRPLSARVSAPTTVTTPSAGADLTWRPATPADLPAILDLMHAASALDNPHFVMTMDQLRSEYETSGFNPVTDSMLALDPAGRAVAYGVAQLSPGQDTLVKVEIPGSIHPDLRRRGLGTALLTWQEERGLQLLAGSEKTVPGWLSTSAMEHSAGVRALAAAHGYAEARWWFELRRDLAAPIPEVALDSELRLAVPDEELSEPTREAFNDSFRDHWGSQPTTREDWESQAKLDTFRGDLSRVAVAPDGTVAALVMSEVNRAEWEPAGFSFGYIGLVAVRRAWRGRGLAQSLIGEVLAAYRAEGFEKAMLHVDSESPTGALGLYTKLGFSPDERSVSLVREF
ncbi:GNAT family N-acetyltransferase [Mycetocola spongiae]|uniref:GNAT family N-acetyltransferase n=1 Tax=Mycetocola spongiae TaxID=2859226 RepID=UPI001CF0DB6E|nr:GNAT family N-acetyltransferase [Mycetocola spongiae]UCR88833.1 GNAT family N-acetyltransferase [Mycetocola spongiae]